MLGSLTKLQLDGLAAFATSGGQFAAAPITGTTNVLHELKSTEVGASMGQMDAMTLDVVAMIFDQMFDDPKIPLGAKGLIGRLQIPMLKVAIADKELFSKKTHPARRLLDTLGEIAIRLPADFNTGSALFGHLETIVQGLVSGYEADVEIFDIVRLQLVALMAREDARIEKEAQAAAERAMQEEALAVAKGAAQEEVRARVAGRQLPGAVLEFLVEHWLKLMMIIHARRGPASDAWLHAIEAMEQLIWSVQPKDSAEERRKLAAIVPPLLKRLAAGLEVAGIEHEVREFFFAELMKAHMKIMSTPLKGKGAAEPATPPPPEAAPAAALDFTASITVRNPFGGGEVQVQELEVAHGAAKVDALLDGLRQGDWVEFVPAEKEPQEQRRPARLIFISPRKTRYSSATAARRNTSSARAPSSRAASAPARRCSSRKNPKCRSSSASWAACSAGCAAPPPSRPAAPPARLRWRGGAGPRRRSPKLSFPRRMRRGTSRRPRARAACPWPG